MGRTWPGWRANIWDGTDTAQTPMELRTILRAESSAKVFAALPMALERQDAA